LLDLLALLGRLLQLVLQTTTAQAQLLGLGPGWPTGAPFSSANWRASSCPWRRLLFRASSSWRRCSSRRLSKRSSSCARPASRLLALKLQAL
jgi:hypothetical protein